MLKSIIPALVFFTFSLNGYGQELDAPSYQAGFKIISLTDSSRIYKPNTSPTDRLHYRSLELDVWYPAQNENSSTGKMYFRDFLESFEDRANRFQDENDYTGMALNLAQSFAVGLGLEPDKADSLLNYETNSYPNAEIADGKFPLILYLAGFNGMGFENNISLENLAQHGYIVVSIWSVGRYPGDMTNDKLDMLEQVYDAEFAVKALQNQTDLPIDFDKIGVLGTSWGGMSSAVLLDRNPTIDALVSLDGTETFYFGESEDENAYLNEIYNSDLIHPGKMTAPYLYIESGNKLDGFIPSGEYNYFKKSRSERFYLRFSESKHEDFLSIPSLLKVSETTVNLYQTLSETTLRFFDTYLKNKTEFKSFYNKLATRDDVSTKPFEY
ncbi:alpha/beta hydrolase family protein [Rhodohalobacter sp. 614A]|uniref:alpha/beta hydrolase family protein n=1 Tax=Rhodohalobacter sp. 614A TaxID=2908649 RepID=UPI001F269CEA|nr:alpha/beta hydrolase [Rhodohalobacter sp. 614A]